MIKTVLTFLRYGVLIVGGLIFVIYFLTFLGLLDYTLIAYALQILSNFNVIRLDTLFNYPNVLLLMGYFLFKELLMTMIRYIKGRIDANA